MISILIIFLLGAGQGLLASLFGLGGGVFLVPLLPLFFSNVSSVKEASFIALFCIGANCLVNVCFFFKKSLLRYRDLWLALGGFLGAFVVSVIFRNLSGSFLDILLLVTIFIILVRSFVKLKNKKDLPSVPKSRFLFVAGVGVSALSALIGVGSGVLTQMTLYFKNWYKTDRRTPVGNVLLTGVSLGALLYRVIYQWESMNLDVSWTFKVVLGLFLFGFISSFFCRHYQKKISQKLKNFVLQSLLVGLFIASIYQML